MRAIVLDQKDAPFRLEDRDLPVPEPDTVLRGDVGGEEVLPVPEPDTVLL